MENAAWINVDDTGALHGATNGDCTVIGNDFFTKFRSTGSKSRLSVLECLCADDVVYSVNDAGLNDTRCMQLAGKAFRRPATHRQRRPKANKDKLLRVLEYPATPLISNLAENDILAHATRRKIKFGSRSESVRAS